MFIVYNDELYNTEYENTTADHVESLFIDAVKRQLVADVPVCTFLSGECADEIFGGYPFRRPENVYADTFPWSKAVGARKQLLSDQLKSLDLEGYLNEEYQKSVKQIPHINGESKLDHRIRELFYLNMKWFMITLLNRKNSSELDERYNE